MTDELSDPYPLRNRLASNSTPTEDLFESKHNKLSNMEFDFNLAVKLIPEFGGDSQTPLHKFIHCCDRFNETLSKDLKPTFLKFIPHKLNGQAYSVYRFGTFKDWNELKSALHNNFKQIRSIECVQLDLIRATQNKDETVQVFANRIEALLSELNEACQETQQKLTEEVQQLNSKTALRSFQNGLRQPIGLIINAGDHKSLKNAISKALEEEINLNSRISLQHHTAHQPKTQILKCQICQKNGHTASACFSRYSTPHNSRAVAQPQMSTSFNRSSIRIVSCAYCKKNGHHINQCFRKKNSDSRILQLTVQLTIIIIQLPRIVKKFRKTYRVSKVTKALPSEHHPNINRVSNKFKWFNIE